MNVVITPDNFDLLAQEHDILVAYFGAQWCGPCKSFSQVFAKVAADYPDVAFAKIDVDEQPDLAQEFSVQQVPAIMIFRNGVMVFADTGFIDVGGLTDLLKQAQALSPDQL